MIDATPTTARARAQHGGDWQQSAEPRLALRAGEPGRECSDEYRGGEDGDVRWQHQEAHDLDALVPDAGELLVADVTHTFDLERDEADRARQEQPAGDGESGDELLADLWGQFSPRHTAFA